jgi:hypothetical protein
MNRRNHFVDNNRENCVDEPLPSSDALQTVEVSKTVENSNILIEQISVGNKNQQRNLREKTGNSSEKSLSVINQIEAFANSPRGHSTIGSKELAGLKNCAVSEEGSDGRMKRDRRVPVKFELSFEAASKFKDNSSMFGHKYDVNNSLITTESDSEPVSTNRNKRRSTWHAGGPDDSNRQRRSGRAEENERSQMSSEEETFLSTQKKRNNRRPLPFDALKPIPSELRRSTGGGSSHKKRLKASSAFRPPSAFAPKDAPDSEEDGPASVASSPKVKRRQFSEPSAVPLVDVSIDPLYHALMSEVRRKKTTPPLAQKTAAIATTTGMVDNAPGGRFCICRGPNNPGARYIACSVGLPNNCNGWVHVNCAGLADRSDAELKAIGDYVCTLCRNPEASTSTNIGSTSVITQIPSVTTQPSVAAQGPSRRSVVGTLPGYSLMYFGEKQLYGVAFNAPLLAALNSGLSAFLQVFCFQLCDIVNS